MAAVLKKHRLIVDITTSTPVTESKAGELVLLAMDVEFAKLGIQKVVFSNFRRVLVANVRRDREKMVADVESAMDYLREVRNELKRDNRE